VSRWTRRRSSNGQPLSEESHERRIGPYLLVERIAEGGMGEVWRAEQLGQVLARFESERQALALMEHPAIAKIYDGGTTPDGRPYFAMEFVSGVPITEHCDRHKLAPAARLELFLQLCEGAQHAHQKAIAALSASCAAAATRGPASARAPASRSASWCRSRSPTCSACRSPRPRRRRLSSPRRSSRPHQKFRHPSCPHPSCPHQ
jgi:hypothetical protein